MEILEWLGKLPRTYTVVLGLLLTLVIGYVDYVTGYELRMELFYLIPIAYVTWFAGQRVGIFFSLLSIMTIFYSDIMAGKKYTSFTVEFWNGAMYFVFYLIVTLLLKLRVSLQQRENLLEELDTALKQNMELAGLLPLCANCRSQRTEDEYLRAVERYINSHKAECAASLCGSCMQKTKPGFGKKQQ